MHPYRDKQISFKVPKYQSPEQARERDIEASVHGLFGANGTLLQETTGMPTVRKKARKENMADAAGRASEWESE